MTILRTDLTCNMVTCKSNLSTGPTVRQECHIPTFLDKFLPEHSNMNTYVIVKRKAKLCTCKGQEY